MSVKKAAARQLGGYMELALPTIQCVAHQIILHQKWLRTKATTPQYHPWPKKSRKKFFAKFFRSFFAMGAPPCTKQKIGETRSLCCQIFGSVRRLELKKRKKQKLRKLSNIGEHRYKSKISLSFWRFGQNTDSQWCSSRFFALDTLEINFIQPLGLISWQENHPEIVSYY